MTDNNHPINPPPELVQQWMQEASGQPPGPDARVIATLAARWGADEQLEMDATWVALQTSNQMSSKRLIAEMRPQPPSLKEQALQALDLAALAESEPEGPTLDEIDDLCAEHSFFYEDSKSLECLLLIITDALARWGK
jgi:hypothetical protein